MNEIVIILAAVYAFLLIWLLIGWIKLDELESTGLSQHPFFSILIPARNEEKNIELLLSGLVSQNYPANKFEIIVLNDGSTDKTSELTHKFIEAHPNKNISCIDLKDEPGLKSPKKRALKTGVDVCKGAWIITTDADCLHQKNWLQNFAFEIEKNSPVFISAPVSFFHSKSFFSKIQSLEFAGLIGIGGASISNGRPTMCNGANLAFKKEAFYKVNGYIGNDHLTSGDDEFLLHKLSKLYPGKISFIKNRQSVVHTNAHKSFKSFVNQRKRWVSKSGSYNNLAESAMAYFVWGYHFLMLFFLIAFPFKPQWLTHFTFLFGTKLLFEFIFIVPVLRFMGKLHLIGYYPVSAFLYILYVSLIALLGKSKFHWKGRGY